MKRQSLRRAWGHSAALFSAAGALGLLVTFASPANALAVAIEKSGGECDHAVPGPNGALSVDFDPRRSPMVKGAPDTDCEGGENDQRRGPQGKPGARGPQGSQGFQGDAGAQGNRGFQGESGAQGFQGFQGEAGAQGNRGFQGEAGAQGFQGFQGTQGSQGSQGSQGASPGAQSSVVTATSATGTATVMCPAGRFATGGGFASSAAGNLEIVFNGPMGGSPATGWQAVAGDVRNVTVYAVCAP